MRTSIICLLALLLSAAGASHAFAQNIKAALNGRVLDSQNNAVANAAITVTDPEHGLSRALVAKEQITVNARAKLLDETEAATATTLTHEQIEALPSARRRASFRLR